MAGTAAAPDEATTIRVKFTKSFTNSDVTYEPEQIYEFDEDFANFVVETKQVAEIVKPEPSLEETVDDMVSKLTQRFEAAAEAAIQKSTKQFSETVERKGFKLPAQPRDEDDDSFGFKSVNDFFRDVMKAGKAGNAGLSQTSEVMQKYATTKTPAGMHTFDDAAGGFLVVPQYSSQFLERMYEVNPFMQRAQRFTTSGNSLKIPGVDETSRVDGSRYGGIQSEWTEEAGTPDRTRPKIRQVRLELHKLMVRSAITEEMRDDTGFDLEPWLFRNFTDEIMFRTNAAFLRGDGVGKPLGILNSPCLVTVSKEDGQVADTITYENVLRMRSRIFGSPRDFVWFVHQDTLPQLASMATIHGTSGTPVYLPPGGASQSPYATLFGSPVIDTEYNSTVGTVGDIVLANMREYAVLTKQGGGVRSSVSMHVLFDSDELAFKVTYRVDGQPTWHSALTPFQGTNTVSPFVALETRS